MLQQTMGLSRQTGHILKQICIISILFIHLTGCQDGPNTALVSGIVKINDQPTENVTLIFTPKNGERASVGTTDGHGHYILWFTPSNRGCIPGQHIVRITAFRDPEDPLAQYIPSQYNDKAPNVWGE
jgi:hypothetical protein